MNIKVMKAVAVWGGIVCALSFLATGCRQVTASTTETVREETELSEEDGASAPVADQTDDVGRAGIDAIQGDMAQQDTAKETDYGESQGNSSGRWHVFSSELARAVDADFAGTVWKIDADSFYIVEEEIELFEDGSVSGSSYAQGVEIPDSELVPVAFDAGTRFYIRTIYDNGGKYEDQEAEFRDLEKYVSVEMKGEFVNDVFHAREIRVIKIA